MPSKNSFTQLKEHVTQLRQNQQVVIGVLLALSIVAIWMAYSSIYLDDLDPPSRGDAYGSLNTLFSGLAFGGVILAIIMQGQELKLQREELERTRKEFEELAQTAKLQRFEHSFYNLLNGFQLLIAGLSVTYHVRDVNSPKVKTVQGENVFYSLLHDNILLDGNVCMKQTSILDDLESTVLDDPDYTAHPSNMSPDELSNRLTCSIAKLPPVHDISHYFKYLFRIIDFIDKSKTFDHKYGIDDDKIDNLIFTDKYHYANIVRSYLSENQLIFLFLNGLNPEFRKMKTYIEKYMLLKNLSGKGVGLKNYEKFYKQEAFGQCVSKN